MWLRQFPPEEVKAQMRALGGFEERRTEMKRKKDQELKIMRRANPKSSENVWSIWCEGMCPLHAPSPPHSVAPRPSARGSPGTRRRRASLTDSR